MRRPLSTFVRMFVLGGWPGGGSAVPSAGGCTGKRSRACAPRSRRLRATWRRLGYRSTGSSPGQPAATLPDSAVVAIARDDDYTFGVLHSRAHELWARGTGTQLREVASGFRYTPTTCFETFPFPRPTDAQRESIGQAAADLVRLRDGWLNPPGLAPEGLAKRTLTNLYNERPTWLQHAHATLDAAVFDAYGWPADLADDKILARLLELNLEREPA